MLLPHLPHHPWVDITSTTKAITSAYCIVAITSAKSGPHKYTYEEELIQSIHNASILATTKLEIMQCAVAKSPKVSISAYGIQIPSLLDLGSEVMLLKQSYFDQYLLPKIKVATSEMAEAHQLFNLMVANDGQLPVKPYTQLDITFLGLNPFRYCYKPHVHTDASFG